MALMVMQTSFFFGLGVACVFGGLAFINGQLLPNMLSWFYDNVQSSLWRTFIASITIFMAANYFNAKGYMAGGQAIGGPVYVIAFILGMVISALLIDKTSLNGHILGGLLVLILGALWVVHGLSQG